ncbi:MULTISPECIES: SlyX family protein [unclassified Halomonas]|uniref:SlyX family protein n=1 Tax=unclassified Halomonas TaxID=2609666 RepID=UPI002469B705|nr:MULTISPECIES: SlyX family protein [unclassified Halomonas]
MSTDTTPAELARRFEALESRIAYQEHWLDTLDAAVAGQEQRLSRLERLNSLMQERLRDQQRALHDNDTTTPGPEDEVPPHY